MQAQNDKAFKKIDASQIKAKKKITAASIKPKVKVQLPPPTPAPAPTTPVVTEAAAQAPSLDVEAMVAKATEQTANAQSTQLDKAISSVQASTNTTTNATTAPQELASVSSTANLSVDALTSHTAEITK